MTTPSTASRRLSRPVRAETDLGDRVAVGDGTGAGPTIAMSEWSTSKSPTLTIPAASGTWRLRATFSVVNLNRSTTAVALLCNDTAIPPGGLASGEANASIAVELEGEVVADPTVTTTVTIGYKPTSNGQVSTLVNDETVGVPSITAEQLA